MKTIKRLGRLLLVAAFGLSALTVVQNSIAASNVEGYITASVVTSGGDGVSGATVTVTHTNTGFTRTLTTAADGTVRFGSLPVGSYDVSVSSSAGNASRSGVNVSVGTGTPVTLVAGGDTAELGGLSVTAQAISPIDITSTESATILGEATIDRIPVGRNVTAVALLAPGTTAGDSAFGNLASFGGATVGENVCYINGLNVTDFRNGLGCSSVPFEFYQEFQLKTGGYSAEFGRATGGVINAVTKSGTNDYKYGFNLFFEPWLDAINTASPNSYRPTTTQTVTDPISGIDYDVAIPDGSLYIDNQEDERTALRANLYASGPIIKDKAFFYVLYEMRDIQVDNVARTSQAYVESSSDDAFWGVKLDYNLSSNHTVELTAFSDESTTEVKDYNMTLDGGLTDQGRATTFTPYTITDLSGTSELKRGGTNYVLRYTGYITPDFTLSAMYGENEYDLTDSSPADLTCPVIQDARASSTNAAPGCWINGVPSIATDTREAMRIDGEWFLGDHQIKFGFDNETNTSVDESFYSGTYYWRYETNAALGIDTARLRILSQGGEFETTTSAIYVEDTWSVTDDVTLRLGLRNESFENLNGNGESFIEINSQIAPRIGVAWDALGDGTLKLFANYGRYYLPVANNTNVRMAGAELFIQEYYEYGTVDPVTGDVLTVIDANGNTINFDPANINRDPNATSMIGGPPITVAGQSRTVFGDGSVADTLSIVDANIDPMYQDEFIFGAIRDMGDGWSVGARAVFREMKSTLEDITTDAAFSALGFDGAGCGIGAFHYVLANPGSDVTITWDCPTGTPETYTLSAEDLAYPESVRKYNAVELLVERAWDGVWFMQGSYTWSQNYGNNEGYVRSDNGQTDAGLTTLYDFAGLLDNAYGPLPNDRTHAVKLYGAYQFAPNWRVGANFLLESGRPINAFGVHPTDPFSQLYGSESFFQAGQPVQRGSRGRTPMTTKLDLSLDYNTTWGAADVNLGVDLFNVFDANGYNEVNEVAEADNGGVNTVYLQPTAYQAPRSIRFRAQFDF